LTRDIVENYPTFVSSRFPDFKVYLFNEWGPGSLRKELGNGGNLDLIQWASAILFVGLILGGSYFMFRRRKQGKREDH
jgi:hypothetical protein